MAKSKKKTRRRKSFTLPMGVVLPIAQFGLRHKSNFTNYEGLKKVNSELTGFDVNSGKWKLDVAKYGGVPILMGLAVHTVAKKAGLNRALANAGIPWIRI